MSWEKETEPSNGGGDRERDISDTEKQEEGGSIWQHDRGFFLRLPPKLKHSALSPAFATKVNHKVLQVLRRLGLAVAYGKRKCGSNFFLWRTWVSMLHISK